MLAPISSSWPYCTARDIPKRSVELVTLYVGDCGLAGAVHAQGTQRCNNSRAASRLTVDHGSGLPIFVSAYQMKPISRSKYCFLVSPGGFGGNAQ